MRNVSVAAVLAVLGILGFAPIVAAQPEVVVHRDHFLTFDTAVSLPGGTVLPAGTYLFRFMIPSQPGVVQVLSADRSKVYAALPTVPVRRTTATGYQVTFSETPSGTPPQVKAWFCDYRRTGHEFLDHTASAKR